MKFLKLNFTSFSGILEVFHDENGKKFFNTFDQHVFFFAEENFLVVDRLEMPENYLK